MSQLNVRGVGLVKFKVEIAEDPSKGHVKFGMGQAVERKKGELATATRLEE